MMATVTPAIPATVALPPKVRGVIYQTYAIAGLGIGGAQVGYAAADLGQPVWLTVTLAVFVFVGAGLGLTAASNTDTTTPPIYETPVADSYLDADGDGQPDVSG